MAGVRNKVAALEFDARMTVAEGLLDSVAYDRIRVALREEHFVEEEAMPSDTSFRSYQRSDEYSRVLERAMDSRRWGTEAVGIDKALAAMEKVARLRKLRTLCRVLEDESLPVSEQIRVCARLEAHTRGELAEEKLELANKAFDYKERHTDLEYIIRSANVGVRVISAADKRPEDVSWAGETLGALRGLLADSRAQKPPPMALAQDVLEQMAAADALVAQTDRTAAENAVKHNEKLVGLSISDDNTSSGAMSGFQRDRLAHTRDEVADGAARGIGTDTDGSRDKDSAHAVGEPVAELIAVDGGYSRFEDAPADEDEDDVDADVSLDTYGFSMADLDRELKGLEVWMLQRRLKPVTQWTDEQVAEALEVYPSINAVAVWLAKKPPFEAACWIATMYRGWAYSEAVLSRASCLHRHLHAVPLTQTLDLQAAG